MPNSRFLTGETMSCFIHKPLQINRAAVTPIIHNHIYRRDERPAAASLSSRRVANNPSPYGGGLCGAARDAAKRRQGTAQEKKPAHET